MARFPDLRTCLRVFPASFARRASEPSDGVAQRNRLQWRDRVGFAPTSRGHRGERQVVARVRADLSAEAQNAKAEARRAQAGV